MTLRTTDETLDKETLFQILFRGDVDAARDQYMTILHRYLHQKGEHVESKVCFILSQSNNLTSTQMKDVMEMIKAVKEMALLFHKANMSPALE